MKFSVGRIVSFVVGAVLGTLVGLYVINKIPFLAGIVSGRKAA